MSITFKYTVGEYVHTEDIEGNCCPETISRHYMINSFWLYNNTNFYKTEEGVVFEEEDLYPDIAHDPYEFSTTYEIGDIVCVKKKAEVGKIVRVFIAEIRVPETYGGIPVIIYKDNTNLLWNETDLITLEAALILVEEACN